jgi:hypothetical protein
LMRGSTHMHCSHLAAHLALLASVITMVILGTRLISGTTLTPKAEEPQSVSKEVENPLKLPRETKNPLR